MKTYQVLDNTDSKEVVDTFSAESFKEAQEIASRRTFALTIPDQKGLELINGRGFFVIKEVK